MKSHMLHFKVECRMAGEGSTKRNILRYIGGACEKVQDSIATEKRLKISVNGREVLTLYCTPLMVRELIVGIFMTQGIIKGQWCAEDIKLIYGEEVTADITSDEEVDTGPGTITSGCAGGVIFTERLREKPAGPLSISAEKLIGLSRQFQTTSGLYKLTGCVHSSALSDGTAMLCFAEDIGRHNAVDKVIGYCLLEGIELSDKIILTSGRLTSEIVARCSRWGIPLIVSRAAPTDMAVQRALESRITLVGFLRGSRFNIYTHPERVI